MKKFVLFQAVVIPDTAFSAKLQKNQLNLRLQYNHLARKFIIFGAFNLKMH